MSLFFQIVGALCVIFVLLVFALLLYVRHKLIKLAGSLKSGTFKAPKRITLVKQERVTWSNEGAVKKLLEPLQLLGFTPVGEYSLKETPGVQLAALTHAGQQIYAVVYEHDRGGVWADIYSRYKEGQPLKSCTYSNVHHPGSNQLDVPPFRKSVKVPNLEIDALYQRFISERPAYELEPVQPENFAALFEKAYADEMDWRDSRGGPTEDEIRRVAAATGRNVDDATVKEARRRLAPTPQETPPAS